MPRLMKKKTLRPRRRLARRRPMRRFRPVRSVPDLASCSVTRTLVNPANPTGNFYTGTMYQLNDINLAQFARAAQVASAYQHYRVKKVTLILKPTYDTFQQTAGGNGKCRAYYMIDKADAIPTTATLETLKQAGAKPINFDEKPIKISWRPSVLTSVEPIGLQAQMYRVSPFLTTNNNLAGPAWAPSQVEHKGVWFYIDQIFSVVGGTQYQVELSVDFQFKKPIWTSVAGSPAPVHPVVAIEDNSADGIVGGNDVVLPA